ncbi:hypothetical protein BU23DRAFT_569540 [Bimuria novae-zelandiae CBS 107.79]|uniref:Ankyrin n=1 Tax=Bimuria novae-zelandiae CBS 107.79 TaxID=1447943 RepID=A0A6A5V616_9PLEO|nr:hypothetical protein BU23DRAFT_569540 [Bimuria novae-zelandiae CBS 107.79]
MMVVAVEVETGGRRASEAPLAGTQGCQTSRSAAEVEEQSTARLMSARGANVLPSALPHTSPYTLDSALTICEQACMNDSTILLDQAISRLSAKHLPRLYDRLPHSAIRHNAVNILKDLVARGVDIRPRLPYVVSDANTETLQLLLDNGWDINSTTEDDNHGTDGKLPFLWHVLHNRDLVEWGLEHGAHTSVQFSESTPQLRRLLHQTLLEKCVARCSISTYELLRSHGAPHGRRELHLAVEMATYGPFGNGARDEQKHRERLNMVRYLLDVVGLDVNAPDQPTNINILPMHRGGNGRSAGPICYIPTSSMLERDTRDLTWMLLDRGADPELAIEFAKEEYPRFIEDVEAWRERQKRRSRCCIQ